MALNGILGTGVAVIPVSSTGTASIASATMNGGTAVTEPFPLSPDWEKRAIALLWGAADLKRRGISPSHRALGEYIGYSPAAIGAWKMVLKKRGRLPENFGTKENGKTARASLSQPELLRLWKSEIELRIARVTARGAEVNLTTVSRGFGFGVDSLLSRLQVLKENNLWPEGMPELLPDWFSKSNGKLAEKPNPAAEGAAPLQGRRSGFSFHGEDSPLPKPKRKTGEQALIALEDRIEKGERVETRRRKRVVLLNNALQSLTKQQKPVTLQNLAVELGRRPVSIRAWIQEAKLADLLPFGFPTKL